LLFSRFSPFSFSFVNENHTDSRYLTFSHFSFNHC